MASVQKEVINSPISEPTPIVSKRSSHHTTGSVEQDPTLLAMRNTHETTLATPYMRMLILLMTSDRAKNPTVQSSLETAVLDGLLSRSALTTPLDESYHLP
jgi:hypothetical protein